MTSGSQADSLVRVPWEKWHVALVSKSHYRHMRGEPLQYINAKDVRRAQEMVDGIGAGLLTLRFRGVLVTRSGAVMVPGYPASSRLLRSKLARVLCDPRCPQGHTAHLKVAHILKSPPQAGLRTLQQCMKGLQTIELGEFAFDTLQSLYGGSVSLV